MSGIRAGVMSCLVLFLAAPAWAQQPFSVVVTTPERTAQPRTDPVTLVTGQRLDPLSGAETTFGRLTVVALLDSRFDGRDSRQSRQAEALVNVLKPSSSFTVSVGGGVRHEAGGVNVLTTRLVADKSSFGGRLTGNVLFERPLAGNRDAMDVITTIGWMRRVSPRVHLGVETLAEDLEGLWTPHEAEGGAHLFVGSAVRLEPAARSWMLQLTAGADMRAASTQRSSDAVREVGRPGFVMRVSASRSFDF